MTRERFDTTWLPRIGPRGAEALWRWRRKAVLCMAAPLIAGGGSTLIAIGGAAEVVAGVGLWLVAVALLVDFIKGQQHVKALVSEWFGVPVRGLPPMSQRAFDRWSKVNGYEQPHQ